MPRALAAGALLFIWVPPRAQACFLSKKQMEEQNRAKATKPYWVTIVLPAWGAEWEQARLFVRAPAFMREQLSSRLRISIPISSTAHWSCPEGTRQLPPALLQWVHLDQSPKIGCPVFSSDEAQGIMCVPRPASSPLAHRPLAAMQGTLSADHSSAALQQPWLPIIAACLVGDFCGLPLLNFLPALCPPALHPQSSMGLEQIQRKH